MNDAIEERISALLDSELQTHDADNALKSLGEDAELRGCWERYHLIGDVMRGEGVRPTATGIADAVRARIAEEPAIIAAPRARLPRLSNWIRPAAGAAIAASVAVLAVYNLPRFIGQGMTESAPVQVAAAPAPVGSYAPSGSRWKNLGRPEMESKLNSYLVDHSEYASLGGMSGVLPYTTFVSYSAGK